MSGTVKAYWLFGLFGSLDFEAFSAPAPLLNLLRAPASLLEKLKANRHCVSFWQGCHLRVETLLPGCCLQTRRRGDFPFGLGNFVSNTKTRTYTRCPVSSKPSTVCYWRTVCSRLYSLLYLPLRAHYLLELYLSLSTVLLLSSSHVLCDTFEPKVVLLDKKRQP